MNPSSRPKHSFSAGPTGFSAGRTKVVYGRRGRSLRGLGGGSSGVPGLRRWRARRITYTIAAAVTLFGAVIGAVMPKHHYTYRSNSALNQLNHQLGQMQATLPSFDAFTSELDVQSALLQRDVSLDGLPVCPDDQPNQPGHRFSCTVQVDGHRQRVSVSVTTDRQGLNVGQPTSPAG